MRRILCWLWLGWAGVAAAAPPPVLEWRFDQPGDILSAPNMQPGRAEHGRVTGWTSWDPYVMFTLPREGFDAGALSWLTVRLYSSTPADLLDIFYKSPDGRWCLGGKFKIVQGWATYRQDLTKNTWRETTSGDASKQWGGPSKRVVSFRIDPGNEADRWVMIDSVRLSAPPTGEVEGVTPEPLGTATVDRLDTAPALSAGEPVKVAATLKIQPPAKLTAGTAFVRLWQGKTIFQLQEQPCRFDGPEVKLSAELATSRYWYPADLAVEVGVYELPQAKAERRPVTLVNPRVGHTPPPQVGLQRLGGDPVIQVNGQPFPGQMYSVYGGLHLDHHREIAGTGVHLYSDWFGGSNGAEQGHVEPGKYDYSEYDRYFAAILDVDPNAWFLPHLGVTAPLWWQKAHPDELCRLENGEARPGSFASDLWRQDSAVDLRKLLQHLRQAPYADRIIGYCVYSGYTAEWQNWGTWETSRCDYSAPAVRRFRAWLTARYGSDAALQAAWGNPKVTLAAAKVPDWATRRPGGTQVLRDPRYERQAIDWYEFANHLAADAALHFAKVAREETKGQALIGTYYAYLSAHGINQLDSGHCAAREVFDSPDIDFLMSPPNYGYRLPAEVSTFMSATDSMRLRGKLWLDESDHRTVLSDPSAGFGRADNMPDSVGVFWREFSEVLCKRAAVSWYDMGGGWYAHPDLLGALGRAQQTMTASLPARRPFQPEIGVFVDPPSLYISRPTNDLSRLILRQLVAFPKVGAPFDYCLLEDLDRPFMPDYKLYVFLNAFQVDAERAAAIQRKLRRNGATALFIFAPGYWTPAGGSLDAARRLTGIQLGVDPQQGQPQLQPKAGEPLTAGLDPTRPIGADERVTPVFFANDPAAHVVARLTEGNRAGLVVKPQDGWTSVYSAASELPPGLLRNLARSAGVHVWLDSDDACYTDGRFVGVHAATAGDKVIQLAAPVTTVINVITGEQLAVKDGRVTVHLARAQTALLELR